MKKFVAFLLMFALALVFIGCGGDNGDKLPTRITLNDATVEVEVGATKALIAKVEPSDAVNKAVEWKSSDEAIATVDTAGRVTGVAEGTATITVTAKADSKVSVSITVTVVPVKLEELVELSVSGANQVIQGKPVQFKATPTPAGASAEVTWSLEAAEGVDVATIATIDEEGVVEAKASGEVTVVATSKVNPEIKGSKKVTCVSTADIVHPLDVSLSSVEYSVGIGKKVYISRTFVGPADETGKVKTVTNQEIHWTSSDETIATVDNSGYVTGVANGTVTITLETDDRGEDGNSPITKTVTVTVFELKTPTVWNVSLSKEEIEVKGSSIIKIEVGAEDEDASATYVSSDEAIAKVSENGTVTGVAEGIVTITVTSQADPTKTATVTIKVIVVDHSQDNVPTSIKITGEPDMWVGYSQQLIHSVLPLTAVKTVVWSSSDESVCTVDENGCVTAVGVGTARIKATSTVNKKVYDNFRIKCEIEPPEPPKPNMGGYEIIIMNADSALSDNDPFLENYSGSDKTFKQKAWNEVQEEYNCKITVKAYPAEAPWGNPRINWIKDNAATNQSQCDLGIVSSNWIPDFAKTSSAVDVTDFYNQYGKKQMDAALKQSGTSRNKLYIASTGLSVTAVNVDIGLYYNYGMVKRLGLDDPATLFNEGNWNYTGFEKWVREAKAKLGDDKYPLGGHPYYFYYGMTNAAGVQIADVVLTETNITSVASKNAMNLMAKLVEDKCMNKNYTWAEAPSPDGNDFFDEGVLMTTGCLWFVRAKNRWAPENGLKWEGDPEFGYVPFPYPDDLAKEDTRIGASGFSVYMYVAGRNYPAGVDTEAVYRAMNDMFLRTHKYQESEETFNAAEMIYNSLKSRIDNDASIEAIMYYNSARTFFDPAHAMYGSTGGTRLRQPSIDVFNGKDFDETFGAVAAAYEEDVLRQFG